MQSGVQGRCPCKKNQRRFTSTLAFMAVFAMQVTGIHTRPASREARCRAAVTPQPTCFTSNSPAPYGRGVGCRGAAPAKSQRRFTSTLAFIASHEACCRMAVFAMQVTGIHTRPASREARCRAAVTPQPTCFTSNSPAPYGRGVGCRGAAPAKSQRRFTSTLAFIASHEACCRMAVFAMQATGIHTRPASRGTRRATAVTPQPSGMSLYAPARIARSPGSRGTAPA